ncbi:hypothetical protein GJ496_000674 [Pomphorhynchus laevis]|nr:hypothetical protein GJ496_000674 [Pomphorhynchus laevis]
MATKKRSEKMSKQVSHDRTFMMFNHSELICPTNGACKPNPHPPLHFVENYWAIVMDSWQCNNRNAIQFNSKSIFHQSIADIVKHDNGELTGFLLFLSSHCSRTQFNHYVKEIQSIVANYLRPGLDDNEGNVDNSTADDFVCNNALINELGKRYHSSYDTSSYHYRFQRQILQEHAYILKDFLYHEHSLRHLTEFFENEHIASMLSFWLAADNFRRCVMDCTYEDKADIKMDALAIYKKYVGLGSPYYLGFDEAMRSSIECSISPSTPDETLKSDVFDQAMLIAYRTLEQIFLLKFRKSIMYTALLGELTLLADRPVEQRTKSSLSVGVLDSLGRYIRTVDNNPNLKQRDINQSEAERTAETFARNFINDVIYRNTSCVLHVDNPE